MRIKSHRGRAQLRDLGPAAGVYEVDYIIHTFVQRSKHIGAPTVTHKVSSADVRPVNGYLLKNGIYALESADGTEMCRLLKTGAQWELVVDTPSNKGSARDEQE